MLEPMMFRTGLRLGQANGMKTTLARGGMLTSTGQVKMAWALEELFGTPLLAISA